MAGGSLWERWTMSSSQTPVALHRTGDSWSSGSLCLMLLALDIFHRMSVLFQECSTGENYCCVLLYLDAFMDKKCLSYSFLSGFLLSSSKESTISLFSRHVCTVHPASVVPWGSSSPYLAHSSLSPECWGPGTQGTEIHPGCSCTPADLPQSQGKPQRLVKNKMQMPELFE